MRNRTMRKHPGMLCLLIAILMLFTVSCKTSAESQDPSAASGDAAADSHNAAAAHDTAADQKVNITIGGKTFTATFKDNETAKMFMDKMPQSFKMSKLNGNEIYKYLDYTLPEKAIKVSKIHKGDIMLYGDDCVVIFYKTFETSYKYTKIGKIDNTRGLKKAVKKKKEKVRFSVKGEAKDPTDDPGQETEAMKMKINDKDIAVVWEDNASVRQLQDLAKAGPLQISMSMYGGFEQVGPIGQSITRDDKQITTKAGDIVLYSGNQIVVFYGSNTWDYTMLGHIDLPVDELTELLGNGDVTISISSE